MSKDQKKALLVIDVQNEYFTGALPITYPQNTLPNILDAVTTSQKSNIPVVIVQHTATADGAKAFVKDSFGWQLHKSIKDIKTDHYIEKTMPSSFVGTDLEEWLKTDGIDTVVISGYMTQHCCDTTARYAHHLGFDVEFLSDATGTLDFENKAGKVSAEELHRATLVEMQFRFGDVLTTQEWIKKLSTR